MNNTAVMEDYQSLKRRMEEVEDSMECSACFTVPRQLPIPCCPSGHLICGDCRGKVKGKCPTCRRKLRKGDVNSLAAALYDKVEHRCKFFPCEEKALLADILKHELKCKDRIIKCPGHIPEEAYVERKSNSKTSLNIVRGVTVLSVIQILFLFV